MLRISTVWPDMRGDDVAGLGGAAAGHVLAGRDDADHVDRRASCRRARGTCRARCAAPRHVELHLVHLARRLERDAAGVEGDALADQHDRLLALRPRRCSAARSAWAAGASRCATASSAPMPSFSMSLRSSTSTSSLNSRASFSRLVGEVGGRADVGRQVAEVLASVVPSAVATASCSACVELGLGAERQHHAAASAGARRLLLRLELVEAVERVAHAEHRVAHVPAQRPRRRPSCRPGRAPRPSRRAPSARWRRRAPRRGTRLRRLGFLAQPDQQHALGGDARQARAAAASSRSCPEMSRSALLQRALGGLIDAARGGGELAAPCVARRPPRSRLSPSRATASLC